MNDQVIPYNANFDPLNQGQPPTWSYWQPYNNAPGGALGQLVMPQVGAYISANYGMQPLGVGYQGNLHNNIRQQLFSSAHMTAMQDASKHDMRTMLDVERGFLALTGQNVGKAEEQALANINAQLVRALPYISPQTLDVLTGGRSAANLAHQMHLAGTARRDIVTGALGMSGDTASHVGRGLYDNYFSTPDYAQHTAGLTSLQVGQMFGELNRRGMLPGYRSKRENVVDGLFALSHPLEGENKDISNILVAAGVSNPARFTKDSLMNELTDSQINKLASNTDVMHGMRTVEATRVKDTLDKYKGAIAAVQEIFGENGRPNAPMRELMNALESLSQGGLQQLNPGRTEMMVRNIYNASKAANVDMSTVMGMMEAAGSQTDQMGLNPIFASQMTERGLMFGAAYNAAGLGAFNAWGIHNQKQAIGAHMAAMGRGINSESANRIGALLRLQDRLGGYGAFGGKTKQMIDAVQSGSFDPRWAAMGYSEFVEMAAKDTGLSATDIQTALDAKESNKEFIYKNNVGSLITQYAQPYEFMQKIARPQVEAQAHSLLKKVLGKGDHRDLTRNLADSYMAALKAMPNAVLADSTARNKSAVVTMLEELKAAAAKNPGGAEAKLLQQAGADIDKTLAAFAENAFTATDQTFRDRHGGEGFLNQLLRTSDAAQTETKRVSAEVNLQSLLQQRSAGVMSGGSPLFNFMRALQEQSGAVDQASLAKVLGNSLNVVGKADLAERLAGDLIKLGSEEEELRKLQTEGVRNAAGNKELERQIDAQVKNKTEAITNSRQKIQAFMDENGLTNVLGSLIDAEKKKTAGADGGETNANFNISQLTINAKDGTLVLKDARGNSTAKPESRNGGVV